MFQFNRIDESKTTAGVWVTAPEPEDYDGSTPLAEFKVALWENPEHQRAMSYARKKYNVTSQKRIQNMAPEKAIQMLVDVLNGPVLTDWRGLIDAGTGEEVKHSEENARAMLLNDSEFRDWITETAKDHKLFQNERVEKVKKNSPAMANG